MDSIFYLKLGGIALFAFAVVLFLGNILKDVAPRWNLNDSPDVRKVHTYPTPRIGGILIVITGFICFTLFNITLSQQATALLVGGMIFFILGLMDDMFSLHYGIKFVIQITGVVIFLRLLPGESEVVSIMGLNIPGGLIFDIVLGIWIIGAVNAFNLMDGLNTLAGGLGILFLASYGIYFIQYGITEPLFLIAILIGTLIGFLLFNRTPASMFLGDAGSLYLGFIIATLGFTFGLRRGPVVLMSFPILIIILPALDTFIVMGTRLISGKNPFLPDQSHLHHRLMQLGFRVRHAVIIIWFFGLLFSLLALLSPQLNFLQLVVILIILGALTVLLPHLLLIGRMSERVRPLVIFLDKTVEFLIPNLKNIDLKKFPLRKSNKTKV